MSNVFSFTGTIGRDAEVRTIQSGQSVLSVTVANNVGFGDKQVTQWVKVTLWGKRAEGQLKDYLKKGQQVFISGELTTSEYDKRDGSGKGFALEVNANIVDLVGKKADAPAPQPQAYTPPHEAHRQAVAQHNAHDDDSDIPF